MLLFHSHGAQIMKKGYEQQILSYLAEHEMLSTAEAMRFLPLSEVSVRRIFNRLAESNLVRRVRGGVRPPVREQNNRIPLFLRGQWFAAEKQHLAKRAAEFITPEMAVAIHGGSTTAFLGPYLNHGTVIVNSLTICRILADRFPSGGGPRVILAGGEVDLRTDIISGPEAEQSFARYHTDLAFFSCRALDEHGILDTDSNSTAMICRILANTDKNILIADHSKFQQKALVRGPSWDAVDILITDFDPANHEILKGVRAHGVQVILVNNDDTGNIL